MVKIEFELGISFFDIMMQFYVLMTNMQKLVVSKYANRLIS